MKRAGVAKKSIYDIRAIIEDKRAECLGGFNLALEIWSASVEPMLWTNAESWVNVQKKTMRVLDDLYSTLYRSLFRIGTGCPRVNYYWQLATLLPANILLLKQLLFVYHLFNLPRDSTGRQVAEMQLNNQLPGLINSVKTHLDAINFESSKNLSKWQFKKLAKSYITERNKNQLLEMIKTSKKINYQECIQEEFKRKPYFYNLKLDEIRTRYRISSQMVDTVRANYSNKYRRDSLECQSCKGITTPDQICPRDDQLHILIECPRYSDLRLKYDTQTDLGIVKFFTSVVERRTEEGET